VRSSDIHSLHSRYSSSPDRTPISKTSTFYEEGNLKLPSLSVLVQSPNGSSRNAANVDFTKKCHNVKKKSNCKYRYFVRLWIKNS